MQKIAQVFSFPDTFADKGRTDFDEGSLYDSDMRRQTGCILQGIALAWMDQNVVAGDDFTLRHGVTIGYLGGNDLSCPVIGNGVQVGGNVTLLGGVAIGDNVTIGAGSVVVDSIPDNTLVVGEKARVKVIK